MIRERIDMHKFADDDAKLVTVILDRTTEDDYRVLVVGYLNNGEVRVFRNSKHNCIQYAVAAYSDVLIAAMETSTYLADAFGYEDTTALDALFDIEVPITPCPY